LILGLGNPLSGDDGFGAQVLEFLHLDETGSQPGISLVDAHTDLLNHLESFVAHDRVVLIDAILDPEKKLGQTGQVVVLHEEKFRSWSEASPSVHQMSPLLAVKLFRQLYPAAQTQISLVGLLVDRLTHASRYATADRVREGAAAVRACLL
jgi:hydrogenase maturation protease